MAVKYPQDEDGEDADHFGSYGGAGAEAGLGMVGGEAPSTGTAGADK